MLQRLKQPMKRFLCVKYKDAFRVLNPFKLHLLKSVHSLNVELVCYILRFNIHFKNLKLLVGFNLARNFQHQESL